MDEGTLVLYVRKAAKEALNALGVSVENVITELSEKDCLKFKGHKYQIDWENEKCVVGVSKESRDFKRGVPAPDNKVCNKNSDCEWISGWPVKFGGCGCFHEAYLNTIREYNDLDGSPLREREPPPNIEKPCVCSDHECRINLENDLLDLDSVEKNCGDLKNEIQTLVEEMKSCKFDNECIIDHSFSYNEIFGFYLFRTRAYDDGEYLSLLEEKVIQHRQKCQENETKLIDPPPLPNIICENSKCVAQY